MPSHQNDLGEALEIVARAAKAKGYSYTVDSFLLVDIIIHSIATILSVKDVSPALIIEHTPKLAVNSYGYLWDVLLEKYRIRSYEDIRNVIQLLVEAGLFKANEHDSFEDFTLAEQEESLLSRGTNYLKTQYSKVLDESLQRKSPSSPENLF